MGDGAAVPVPIDPDGPVDLGPGPRGAMVAAFARKGDLYSYDFGDGRTRRLDPHRGARAAPVGVEGPDRLRARPAPVRAPTGGRSARSAAAAGDYDALDLHGRRVAFTRVRLHDDRTEWQLLTQGGSGVARLVDRAASGLLSRVVMLRPEFEDGAIVYASRATPRPASASCATT